MDDILLIKEIVAGNKNEYKHLVEKYQSQVFRTCIGFVHNSDDAHDVAQEVFINAYLSINSFKEQSAFSTWLYRIAVNASLNHLKKNKRREIFYRIENFFSNEKSSKEIENVDVNASPENKIIGEQQSAIIQKAIDSLPTNQHTAFTLSKNDDLSNPEIAEIMNTTVGAVEQLLQRAKVNLQKKLKALV